MTNRSLEDTTGEALKIGVRLLWGVYSLVILCVIAAFGVGVFSFATTDQRLQRIEEKLVALPPDWLLQDVQDLRKDVRSLEQRIKHEEERP